MSVHPSEEKNKNNIDGRIIIASPFERHDTLAQIDALSSFEFQRIKDHRELNIDFLSTLSPTWIFFPHWSHIIPENVYGSFKCVVFHMTNLPFGRGGSPLQNMIIQGLTHTKLSALAVGQGIDTGPVYCKRPLSLHGTALLYG
jgi:methionyl-tRNA formyltransferase